MLNYCYFKDGKRIHNIVDLYMTDNSVIEMYQVENGEVWTLEVFPPNQTDESFNKAEFSGWLDLIHKEWELEEYPSEWNSKLIDEFNQTVREAIQDVTYEVQQHEIT